MPGRLRLKSFAGRLLIVVLSVVAAGCEPSARIQLLDGGAGDWSDFRGKWVFINYWAEWCLPCRKEMPELNRFAERFADRAVVLGVNFDNLEPQELARAAQKMAVEFPVLVTDPGPWLPHERPAVLPTTVVYDPRGQLRVVLTGPQSEASLELWLKPEPVDE